MPREISKGVRQSIKDTWAQLSGQFKREGVARGPTAEEVLTEYKRLVGGQRKYETPQLRISLRSVQDLLRKMRERERAENRQLPDDPPWVPWQEIPPIPPDAMPDVLRCSQLSLVVFHAPLTQKEVAWIVKLRHIIQDHHNEYPYPRSMLLVVARMYARREKVADLTGGPLWTEDLDGWLLFRPWESPETGAHPVR